MTNSLTREGEIYGAASLVQAADSKFHPITRELIAIRQKKVYKPSILELYNISTTSGFPIRDAFKIKCCGLGLSNSGSNGHIYTPLGYKQTYTRVTDPSTGTQRNRWILSDYIAEGIHIGSRASSVDTYTSTGSIYGVPYTVSVTQDNIQYCTDDRVMFNGDYIPSFAQEEPSNPSVGDSYINNWGTVSIPSIPSTGDFVIWVYEYGYYDIYWGEVEGFTQVDLTSLGISQSDELFLPGQSGARIITDKYYDAPWERYPTLV